MLVLLSVFQCVPVFFFLKKEIPWIPCFTSLTPHCSLAIYLSFLVHSKWLWFKKSSFWMKRAKNHIYLVLKSSLHLCKLLVFQNSLIITNLPEVVIFGYFHDFPVPIVQYAPYDECIPMPPIPTTVRWRTLSLLSVPRYTHGTIYSYVVLGGWRAHPPESSPDVPKTVES